MSFWVPNMSVSPRRSCDTRFVQPGHSYGGSLMGVLISLLVVGVGLHGALRLQMSGLTGAYSSGTRTEALLLAVDILERMRANSEHTVLGGYAVTDLSALAPGQQGIYADCAVLSCSPTQLKSYDLGVWQEKFPAALTNGSITIFERSADERIWAVQVRWDDDADGDVGTTCPPEDENDLDCVMMESSF